jgi:UDP-N-acetylmuramoylalanine--D-glutamate ligase
MRVLVVGAGVSGRAAARLARRLGHQVVVYDQDRYVGHDLSSEGFTLVTGEWSMELLEGIDLVVTSPGVPEHAAPVSDTIDRHVTLWSELEFAARDTRVPIVAVTGTNGKTTVTGLITEMLRRGGSKVTAAGNIGTPLSDVVREPWDLLVVEASSFQLRFVEGFRPDVAVVLNVAADHLDWHGSVDAYRRAKARICGNQTSEDVLVYDADDEGASEIAALAASRTIPVSGRRMPPGGAGIVDGTLRIAEVMLDIGNLAVSDPAYLVDLAAAGMAALEAGAAPDAVSEAAVAFRPGAHRREVIGTWSGVAWVNDSKATNPHAALASIAAFESVVLIAGGRNKDLDLSDVVSAPNLRAVVAIGEAAEELIAAAKGSVHGAESIREAVELADGLTEVGDTVLLAPGCASFDMFESYAARGDAFKAAVRAWKEA